MSSQNDKTKHRIAEAMKTLVRGRSIDDITVSEIIEQSGVSRPTFYRHFRDKYDLVNWYFQELCDQSFLQMGVSLSLPEALNRKFQFLQSEQEFFSAAFRCSSQNNLMEYDYECIYHFYSTFIQQHSEVMFTPEIEFVLELYCRGSIAMTARWAVSGMTVEPAIITGWLIASLPLSLRKIFEDAGLL